MQEPKATQEPNRVLFQYFERAVAELGLKAWSQLLVPGRERDFHAIAKDDLYRLLSQYWTWEMEKILHDPESSFRWEPSKNPEEEIKAHYVLQAGILLALMGYGDGLRILASQLATEPMNWKLAISYFLGNLTEGRIGLTYKELPTKAQVLQWVREIERVPLTDRLSEIAKMRTE